MMQPLKIRARGSRGLKVLRTFMDILREAEQMQHTRAGIALTTSQTERLFSTAIADTWILGFRVPEFTSQGGMCAARRRIRFILQSQIERFFTTTFKDMA